MFLGLAAVVRKTSASGRWSRPSSDSKMAHSLESRLQPAKNAQSPSGGEFRIKPVLQRDRNDATAPGDPSGFSQDRAFGQQSAISPKTTVPHHPRDGVAVYRRRPSRFGHQLSEIPELQGLPLPEEAFFCNCGGGSITILRGRNRLLTLHLGQMSKEPFRRAAERSWRCRVAANRVCQPSAAGIRPAVK